MDPSSSLPMAISCNSWSFLLCNWESIWATPSVHVGMNYSTSPCIALTGVPILVSHFQGCGAPCHLPLRWLVRNSCLRILHRDSKSWRADNCSNSESPLRLDCLFYLEWCDVTSNGRKEGELRKICRLRSSIKWRFRQAEFGRVTTPTDERPSVRPSVRPRRLKSGRGAATGQSTKNLHPFFIQPSSKHHPCIHPSHHDGDRHMCQCGSGDDPSTGICIKYPTPWYQILWYQCW